MKKRLVKNPFFRAFIFLFALELVAISINFFYAPINIAAGGATGMAVLLVLTYALEIVVDNVCARMTWRWMLKHAFGITLGLAIFNILWLYVR